MSQFQNQRSHASGRQSRVGHVWPGSNPDPPPKRGRYVDDDDVAAWEQDQKRV